ncbi:MAG TPA: hypothetical protein VKD72_20895 [Gemmataceae bacterium]|nr:hypothetical protein [Gemmataceae bacterium]
MTTRPRHRHTHTPDEPDEPTAPAARAKASRGPGLFRVRLQGVMPLHAGVAQDFLDIEASSEEDAWDRFRELHGILETIHTPEITRLEEPE